MVYDTFFNVQFQLYYVCKALSSIDKPNFIYLRSMQCSSLLEINQTLLKSDWNIFKKD